MLKLGILLAGLIVCLPAIGVAVFLRDLPGASTAALAAFSLIYLPFVLTAVYSSRLGDFFQALQH